VRSSNPNSVTESLDSILCVFDDVDLANEAATNSMPDEQARRLLSQHFQDDLEHSGRNLKRLLALGREQEQCCRENNEFLGVTRCLGNQGLFLKAQGRIDEAMTLFKYVESRCWRLGDVEGLVFALFQQAMILEDPLDQPAAALPLAEEAQRLAVTLHLSWLGNDLADLVQRIRSRIPPS
jgi:hypothetical protein